MVKFYTDYSFRIHEETDVSIQCLVRKHNVTPPTLEEKGPIPVYHLTRCVTISEHKLSDGNTCIILKCSCNYHKKVKGPCRHIYCILDESPIPQHFGLELFKEYEAYYGEDAEYTARVDEFTKEVDSLEGGMLLHTTLVDFKAKKMRSPAADDVSLDWFLETLNQVGKDVNIFQQEQQANKNGVRMNGNEVVPMNVDEAVIKDGGSGKRRLGTHSKHGQKKRCNSTGNALAVMAKRKDQSAYSRNLPIYQEAADACESEDDIQKLGDLLNEFRFATIKKNSNGRQRQNHVAASGSGEAVMSMPEQERQKYVARKKPLCSPSRRK